MDKGRKLLVFVGFFVLAFVFFRLRVMLFYSDGELPLLRAVTGLTIHHFHYGLIFILIAALMLIFWKVNVFSVGLMGFGLGTVYDSFISRMFSFDSVRVVEIAKYNYSFGLTLLLFGVVVLLAIVFYLAGER